MKIANIIYEEDLVNHEKVEYINYYNDKKSYNEINYYLPTLYVGWNFLKECNPNNNQFLNINILSHEILKNKLYWEFSFKENKSSHVKGIASFTRNVPNFHYSSKYQYVNLDPVFYQIKNISDFNDILPKKIDNIYMFKNNMYYFLSEKKIYGIHIPMYEFFKFNKNEIFQKLKDRCDNYIIDDDGEIYQKYYKIFPEFELLKRFMVVILLNL